MTLDMTVSLQSLIQLLFGGIAIPYVFHRILARRDRINRTIEILQRYEDQQFALQRRETLAYFQAQIDQETGPGYEQKIREILQLIHPGQHRAEVFADPVALRHNQ